MWSDFNEANKSAMLKSEVISWPVTLAVLVLAFGSLVAAGLPLMLTMVGLVCAAGALFLGAQLFDISIWAMNFALMFALALGIDYALFIVARFRQALHVDGLSPADAVAAAMETAGKAVLFSGVTVLVSLSAVLLVPSPAFRSMAIGIMFAVVFVLAAALTLLPAVLARRGGGVDRLALPWLKRGDQRSDRARPLGRDRLAASRALPRRRPARRRPARLAGGRAEDRDALDHRRSPPRTARARASRTVQRAFGEGAPGTLQIVAPAATGRRDHRRRGRRSRRRPDAARRSSDAAGTVLIQAVPGGSPSSDGVAHDHRSAADRRCPPGALIGGAVAENHDLEQALGDSTPLGHRRGAGARLPAPARRAPAPRCSPLSASC